MLQTFIDSVLNDKLNEGITDEIKQKIISFLSKVDDIDILSSIFSIIKKKEFEALIEQIASEKKLTAVKEQILNKLVMLKGDTELKLALLETIAKDSVIDVDNMLSSNTPILLKSLLQNVDKDLAERYFWSLASISIGTGNSTGEGEIALIMYIKGAIKPSEGDVKFPGGVIEVKFLKNKKSTGGKLASTNDYVDPSVVFDKYIQPRLKKMGIVVEDPNQCNFTTKEARLYNLLVANGVSHKDALKFIENVFEEIFGIKPDFSKLYNKKFDIKEFNRELSLFLIKRYIQSEAKKTGAGINKFYLLFMNGETKKVLPVQYKDVEKKIDHIRITGTISFKKGAQSPTFRFAIV